MATLSIVGAALLGQPVAGLVIVLMQTGGEWLEHYAEGRASNAVRALEEAAPRTAHRQRADAQYDDILSEEIAIGDLLLVRPGEMLPADGVVQGGRSHLDMSRLTGEAPPEMVQAGNEVRSGAVNLEGALVVRATRLARESLYARIVELVRTAQAEKSPIQRMADRYAVWFTPLTLAVCTLALVRDARPGARAGRAGGGHSRPLLLATPVAIIGGINRAARHQVIVRSGGALERLASVNTAVFDKTGNTDHRTPRSGRGRCVRGVDTGCRASPWPRPWRSARDTTGAQHRERGVAARHRAAGRHARGGLSRLGVRGTVDGGDVAIGATGWLSSLFPGRHQAIDAARGAGLRGVVAVDGEIAGAIEYADQAREGLHGFFDELRRSGPAAHRAALR